MSTISAGNLHVAKYFKISNGLTTPGDAGLIFASKKMIGIVTDTDILVSDATYYTVPLLEDAYQILIISAIMYGKVTYITTIFLVFF